MAGLTLVAALAFSASSDLVVGVLTDERRSPPLGSLETGAQYFPESARLNARLSRYEFGEEDRDLGLARSYAVRAVSLSPWNYGYRLHLATVEEAAGNRDAAQESLQIGRASCRERVWRL